MLEPKTVPAQTEMTPQQRQAIAKAKARLRLQQQGAAPQPAPAQPAAASTADPLAPRNTSGYDRDAVEQGIQDAAYTNEMQQLGIIKRGSDLLTAPQAQPKTPARFGFKWEKRGNDWVEVSADKAKQPNELERFAGDVGRAVAAPFQQNENLRTIAGAPLNLGDGLARGTANIINNVSAVGTEAANAGLNQLDPSRQQFTAPRIDVPQNVIVGEGGFLNSEAGVVPNMVGQIAAARVPLGKLSPKGGIANEAAKNGAAMALTTDAKAPRVSDMIPRTGMGAALDPLRSGENDPTIVSMMKNLGEDLIFSGAGEAMLAGGAKALDAGRKLLPQSPVAPNAGGANLGSPRPIPPQTPANALASPPAPAQAASAAQPSVVPQPTVSQAGTAGTGQQAGAGVGAGGGGAVPPAGPATLQATPRNVPVAVGKEELAVQRDTLKAVSRFMRGARIPRNVVNDYTASLLGRYEPLKSERYSLAFFVEDDLPQYLQSRGYTPAEARNYAGDTTAKLQGWGRAANSFNESGNSARYLIQNVIHRLTTSQKSELESTFKAVLGDETLMGRSDEIGALMRQNGEEAYTNSISEANRLIKDGKASPEQVRAAQELNAILTNEGFKKFYPDSLTVEAATRGKTVDELIQERLAADPIDAAHWLQSEIGKSARNARDGLQKDMASTYEAMRKAILDRLEQFPGYRGARMQHGDLFGADDAVSFGDRFLTAARSEFKTDQMARELEKLSPRQQAVAALSIRDAMLNPLLRGSPEDAAARITELQKEGTLKALVTVLGEERGTELRNAIANMRVENQRISAISQASGSNTHLNQQGARDAIDNIRSPGNRLVHGAGNPTGWGVAGIASMAMGNPLPLVAKAVASAVDKASTPGARFQSRATKGLYGLPEAVDDAAGAVPPNANALASPPPSGGPTPFGGAGGGNTTGNALSRPPPRTRAQRPPPTVDEWAQRIETDQNELQRLLKQYDQIDRADPNVDDLMRANLAKQKNARRRIAEKTKKMEAARAAQPEPEPAVPNAPQIAPANAFNAEPQAAAQAAPSGNAFNGKRPLPGETSNASPAVTGALLSGGLTGGATYAATGDEDLALRAGGLAAIGGAVAGNRLAKFGGRTPPKPPVPKAPVAADVPRPVEPGPVPSIASADLRPAVAKNVTTFKPQKPGIPKIGQTQSVASVTTKDGRQYDVTAEVFKDRDAVVMSPMYPSNIADDLAGAMEHQQSAIRAEARGMKLANDAPRAPDWAEQNPAEWGDVQRQVGTRFLGMVNSTPGPHILALVDGIDINSLGSMIQDSLPKGKVLLKSPANGELAVVDRGAMPEQFQRWDSYNPRYGQSIGQLPKPAEWASAKPAATSATSSVTPLKPAPKPTIVKNGFGSSKLPMDEGARMARAREQGFDVDTPLYHATTSDFEKFTPSNWRGAVFLSDTPDGAVRGSSAGGLEHPALKGPTAPTSKSAGPSIYPVYVRGKIFGKSDVPEWFFPREMTHSEWRNARTNAMTWEPPKELGLTTEEKGFVRSIRHDALSQFDEIDPSGQTMRFDGRGGKPIGWQSFEGAEGSSSYGPAVRGALKKLGYDGALVADESGVATAIFDPSNIRGKFAKFNPAESGSSKLLAGIADNASGKGALGGMALGGTFAPDANGDGVVDAQERANGALGGAFSGGIGGAVAGRALGAFGRGANKLARGVEQAGFGSGRPKPTANRLSGGEKKPGVLGNLAQRAAVGAATGAAVNLATSAGAQDDLPGEIRNAEGKIGSVEQEIAALKKAKADFDKITDLKEKQRLLNRVGLYNGDIDGKFKGLTTDAINAWDAKNAAAIEKAETALAAGKKDLEALKKQDAYRQMQKEQNPFFDAVRELGPSGAAILGGVAATVFRVRSVGKSAKAAKVIENDINDLLTNGPVKRLMAKGGADNKPRNRAVNMNQFYREGGAPDNKLPFNYGPSGWKPNPKAVKPGSLYKSDTTTKMDGVGSQFVRPTDVKIIGAGVLDSALVTPFVSDAEEELRKAEADVEGGNESVEALRRVEKAKTNLAMYQAIQRLGWGIAGAGALGLGYRYKLPKPDIRGAEDEVTAISDYLKSKAPPRTPRAPKPQPVAPPSVIAAPTTQLLLPLPPPKPKKPKKP